MTISWAPPVRAPVSAVGPSLDSADARGRPGRVGVDLAMVLSDSVLRVVPGGPATQWQGRRRAGTGPESALATETLMPVQERHRVASFRACPANVGVVGFFLSYRSTIVGLTWGEP